ncbi:putative LRR containing protein, partial [Trachipleistophora hominis]
VDYDVTIKEKIVSSKMSGVVFENGHMFTLRKESHIISIEKSTGIFNLFKKINLVIDPANRAGCKFFLQTIDNYEEPNIISAFVSLSISTSFLSTITNISFIRVKFIGPILLEINNDIKKLNIEKCNGTIKTSGIVNGTLSSLQNFVSEIVVVKVKNEPKYDLKIAGYIIPETLTIYCILKNLMLENVYNSNMSCFRVVNTCEYMELNNYFGIVEMDTGPCLKSAVFNHAICIYSEATGMLDLKDGGLRLDTYFLPRTIRHLRLKGLVMNVSEVFHLHDILENIEICNCFGLFNFKNVFNIAS